MIEITVTTANRDNALQLAQAVMTKRLAACANVTDYVTSLYWWNDKLHHDQEAVVTFKTSTACAGPLTDFIRAEHEYDLPAIICHEVSSSEEYEAWVNKETNAP